MPQRMQVTLGLQPAVIPTHFEASSLPSTHRLLLEGELASPVPKCLTGGHGSRALVAQALDAQVDDGDWSAKGSGGAKRIAIPQRSPDPTVATSATAVTNN